MSVPVALLIALFLARGTATAGVNAPTSAVPTPTPTIVQAKQISRRVPDRELMWRGCDVHGIPTVSFIVNPDGTTRDHRVFRTSGCASADRIYLSFVRRFWRYTPSRVNGVPVVTEITETVSIDY